MERPAGHDFLGLAGVGQDLLGRKLQASGGARERHRSAEELHELAPGGAADLGRAGRELSLHGEAALALLEAAPLLPWRDGLRHLASDDGKLQRWHVVQLVRVATWYSALSRSPNASCSFSPPAAKVMLVTSSRGRRKRSGFR